MGNTTFYKEVRENSDKITWKEIFSECTKKHTKADLEYALLTGTSMDTASPSNMLNKWHKPWVFFSLLKLGIGLICLLYLSFFISFNIAGAIPNALHYMVIILPPLVIPIIVMIFFWELNIPRNISIYELFLFFLVGGILAFVVLSFLFGVIPPSSESFSLAFGAAAREEPAKLLASIVVLWWCSNKKKKIYGLTGLVVGAAVGAGFGAFESMDYALQMGSYTGINLDLLSLQMLRNLFAIGGHTLYTAPYMAAFALKMRNGEIRSQCFTDRNFLLLFGISCFLHFAWDYDAFSSMRYFLIIAALWMETLYITRFCLKQVVKLGTNHRKGSASIINEVVGNLIIECTSGPLHGAIWNATSDHHLVAGRDSCCSIKFPAGTHGISRTHCEFRSTSTGWCVVDLDSTYGTWVNDKKLIPGIEHHLSEHDIVYLATKECSLLIKAL